MNGIEWRAHQLFAQSYAFPRLAAGDLSPLRPETRERIHREIHAALAEEILRARLAGRLP